MTDKGRGDRSGAGVENMTDKGYWHDTVPCEHGHLQWYGANFVLCGQCMDRDRRPTRGPAHQRPVVSFEGDHYEETDTGQKFIHNGECWVRLLDWRDVEMRGPKHASFKRLYGDLGNGRLDYGLDFVKAMPRLWTDEKRLATMVMLYDELVDQRELF